MLGINSARAICCWTHRRGLVARTCWTAPCCSAWLDMRAMDCSRTSSRWLVLLTVSTSTALPHSRLSDCTPHRHGTASVCPSVCLSHLSRGGFAAGCPADRRYRPSRHSARRCGAFAAVERQAGDIDRQRRPSGAQQHVALQQIRAVSRCQLTWEIEDKLVKWAKVYIFRVAR